MKSQVKKNCGYLSCPGRGTAMACISPCAGVRSAGCSKSKAPSGVCSGSSLLFLDLLEEDRTSKV